ncbi:hypothetical protein I2709_001239 [Vibrio mimicus]
MSLSKKFISLLKDENSQTALIDGADAVAGYLADDELLSSIPVVNTMVSVGKGALSYRDRKLVKKISIFLSRLEDVEAHKITEFVDRLENDDYREKVGDKLLTLLDRADDDEKAKIIGGLFKLYVTNRITRDTFDVLAHTVDRVHFFELHHLRHMYKNEYSMQDIGPLFLPFRIVKLEVKYFKHSPNALFGEYAKEDHVVQTYELTSIGKQLVSFLNELYG